MCNAATAPDLARGGGNPDRGLGSGGSRGLCVGDKHGMVRGATGVGDSARTDDAPRGHTVPTIPSSNSMNDRIRHRASESRLRVESE